MPIVYSSDLNSSVTIRFISSVSKNKSMVYVRWIRKKNGTLVGPYLYKSVRTGKTVTGKYVGKATSNDLKKYKNETKKMRV
jgi:hypothetical protein